MTQIVREFAGRIEPSQLAQRSPVRAERPGPDDYLQRPPKLPELGLAELRPPSPDRLACRLLRGECAGNAAAGQDEERGPRIERMRLARDVAPLFELMHELGGSLLGYAQVVSDVGSCRVASADPHERKAVRWPDIPESAACHSVLDGLG